MIAGIVTWMVSKGVSERLAKPLLIVAAFVALMALLGAAIALHDHRVITANDEHRAAKAAPAIAKAKDQAAADRATDTIAISKSEQGAHDAISKAPKTAPSPAAIALGCDRLRRAGQDVSRLPQCG